MRILCIRIETSYLCAEYVNKNRCISVRLISEEDKSIKIDNFDNSHNSFLWPEYFIDFLCERWIPCQALTSVLCLHYHRDSKTLIMKVLLWIHFNSSVCDKKWISSFSYFVGSLRKDLKGTDILVTLFEDNVVYTFYR